ncbi:ATP-binding protein [Streptomyces sp. NPDC058613]|uniref:ATP-binding protein n=1 Tax=unclassified Streptomyces TaxID=2593676 RepID=UPI0036670828
MSMMSAERAAPRSLSAVDVARHTARAFFGAFGQLAIGREQADTVVLVVSELVTSALRHGGGACTLRLTTGDPSPRMPRTRTPDLVDGTDGFGWHVLNDLAHRVVVPPGPEGGKTVRALLPRQHAVPVMPRCSVCGRYGLPLSVPRPS